MMSKEQIKQWIKEKDMKSVDDVQSALKDLFAETIQEMLEAEMESSLGYAKHDMKRKRTTNSRNGYSKKTGLSKVLCKPVYKSNNVIVQYNQLIKR
ncbi:transposase [Brevibacillus sp. IT-7CA2]